MKEDSVAEMLISGGEGREDAGAERVSGRVADNRPVRAALPTRIDAGDRSCPRDMVRVVITRGAPHHLVADSTLTGGFFKVRRTRAGEAWAVHRWRIGQLTTEAEGRAPISLGMLAIRRCSAL